MSDVLVIEDSVSISKVIEMALSLVDISVKEADTGEAGLEAFNESQPKLVLTDISLPGIDGFQVIESIRGTGFTGPVVAMSGSPEELERARAIGVDAVLEKPFDIDALVNLMKEFGL